MGWLDGESVVVTGAGHGLGRAYAIECAAQGANVVVNDIDQAAAAATVDKITVDGGAAVAHVGSAGVWDSARGVVDLCILTFGRITGLVNNAGILHASQIWEEDERALREIIEVNLLGTMFCSANAMTHMVAQRHGSIVNVTSSIHLGGARVSAYGATKAAITSMTYSWAMEGEPHGVRVNAISPLARTKILDQWDGNSKERSARGDYAEPEKIAPLVAALLSPSSSPLTGCVLRHDGRSIYPLRRAEFTPGDSIAAASTPHEVASAFT